MEALRRLLRGLIGTAGTSGTHSRETEISITYDGEEAQTGNPPEAVIEPPVKDEPPSEASDKPISIPLAEQATPVVPAGSTAIIGTRPLPPLEAYVPKPGQRILYGLLSDVGMVRGNNQDAVMGMYVSSTTSDDMPDFGLFIVADGMGGHHDGEKASAITVRMVAKHVIDDIYSALLTQQMNDPDRPGIADILRDSVQLANETVTRDIPEGGTTVTSAVIMGDLAYIAHVGDSRAYMINDEGIEQLTRDHSLVQRLIELDQLTPEEAAEHPQRNVLYRAIGQNDNLDVDAITRRLMPRARLLLCSDGLWNLVSEDTILEIVRKHSNPQEACNHLVQLANDRGGSDNITVILIQVPG